MGKSLEIHKNWFTDLEESQQNWFTNLEESQQNLVRNMTTSVTWYGT